MALRVNMGSPFIHPVTNHLVGPGQFYEGFEIEKKAKKESISKEVKEDITEKEEVIEGGEPDGQTESDKQTKKGNRGSRGTTNDK